MQSTPVFTLRNNVAYQGGFILAQAGSLRSRPTEVRTVSDTVLLWLPVSSSASTFSGKPQVRRLQPYSQRGRPSRRKELGVQFEIALDLEC